MSIVNFFFRLLAHSQLFWLSCKRQCSEIVMMETCLFLLLLFVLFICILFRYYTVIMYSIEKKKRNKIFDLKLFTWPDLGLGTIRFAEQFLILLQRRQSQWSVAFVYSWRHSVLCTAATRIILLLLLLDLYIYKYVYIMIVSYRDLYAGWRRDVYIFDLESMVWTALAISSLFLESNLLAMGEDIERLFLYIYFNNITAYI